ncbi:hypothetical protein BG36_22535 [Aquamicrobium defluvii]|uniref:Uncharacterized protein n=1 Tax=Aquamicrobium defluvii TaxID=69279 RepID=A0A011VM69_9HYPH|nr:hypothetical protein BG36_22535 [Aquamicrobium defluvii]EZQ13664.1 hypothetical protein CF98_23995 [Halopseudomonas bauzanensis]
MDMSPFPVAISTCTNSRGCDRMSDRPQKAAMLKMASRTDRLHTPGQAVLQAGAIDWEYN